MAEDATPEALSAEDLKARLLAEEKLALSTGGPWTEAHRSRVIARNVLQEEIGRFGPMGTIYSLSEDERDRLIAHTRQDSAHALMITDATAETSQKILRAINFLIGAMLACTALIVVVVYRASQNWAPRRRWRPYRIHHR